MNRYMKNNENWIADNITYRKMELNKNIEREINKVSSKEENLLKFACY